MIGTKGVQGFIDLVLSRGGHRTIEALIADGFAERNGDRVVATVPDPARISERKRRANEQARLRMRKRRDLLRSYAANKRNTEQNQELTGESSYGVTQRNSVTSPNPALSLMNDADAVTVAHIHHSKEVTSSSPSPEPESKRVTSRLLPADFVLTPKRRQSAAEYWTKRTRKDLVTTVEDVWDGFVAYHTSRGSRMVDWDAAWRTWYQNAVRFNRPAASGNGKANGGQFVPAHEYTAHRISLSNREKYTRSLRKLGFDESIDLNELTEKDMRLLTEDPESIARQRVFGWHTEPTIEEARASVQEDLQELREKLEGLRRQA